jgi:hypothetical protein
MPHATQRITPFLSNLEWCECSSAVSTLPTSFMGNPRGVCVSASFSPCMLSSTFGVKDGEDTPDLMSLMSAAGGIFPVLAYLCGFRVDIRFDITDIRRLITDIRFIFNVDAQELDFPLLILTPLYEYPDGV